MQAEGGKWGAKGQGTKEDVGTRSGAQRQSAEDDGGKGWMEPRWTAFHSEKGGGERVRQRVLL